MRSRSFRVGPADDHELLAVQPFGFAPKAAVSWRIGRVDRLGDDVLKTKLAGVPKDQFAVTRLMAIELKAWPGLSAINGSSSALRSMRGRRETVLAIEVQEIEGVIDEPAGLPGAQGAGDPQDRSKRCAGAGAFGSHWLLQARAREIAASSCAPLTDQRAQEAGRPTGDLGKSDPWSCGRVRGPTAPGARRRLHRQRS